MGSGRVPTCIGLVAVLVVLALAPVALAQPIRRVTSLDDPFGALALPHDASMAPVAPVAPRTAYQPPRDPGADPNEPDFVLPDGAPIAVPQSKSREFRIGSRYGTKVDLDELQLPDGSKRFLLVGGWVVNAASFDGQEATEFAADQIVIWTRGRNVDNIQKGFTTDGDGKSEVEFYMSGNVVIRSTSGTGGGKTTETVRALEVYYDAQRNKAIALRADIEMLNPRSVDPIHLKGDEVRRLDLENWEILYGTLSASKLPSDPGLYLESERFTMNARRVVRRNIFNIPYRSAETGEEVETIEKIITGKNVVTRLDDVPVFYTPDLLTNVNSPLGPVRGFTVGTNRQFGNSIFTTYDLYDLLALVPPPTDKWRLNLDYMSKRGAGIGTDLNYFVADPEVATNPPGTPRPPSIGSGVVTAYALPDDKGFDLLPARGPEPNHPAFRDRFTWRDQRELGDEFYNQGQISYLSDYNFLEQYYPNEFAMGPNQETFEYLAWQRRNFGANVLLQDRLNQTWWSQTNALPLAKGELIGQTFLDDLFVYNAQASAGYLQSRPAMGSLPNKPYPPPLLQTDVSANSGRFDLWQELNVPLTLGPVKFAPYGIVDLTEYTADINGNETGRIYGAGGVRASLPFSRLYDDVSSELMNLRGLYHKVSFDIDYRYARTNVPYTQLPMFDRLDDEATDQGYRNFTPFQSQYVAGPTGVALQNGPAYSPYNPQLYAIRRVVEGDVDTLDNIDVLQMDVRQRFQTKRGYPGAEHTVDFLTFDLSASYFPEAGRDNFGHPFAFLEYAATWNVGDRTAIVSNGWFEPYQNGSRYWNIGAYLNRTDRTGFYLGYRQTDPLNSKEVSMNLTYQLSHQYFLSIGANYDFGLGQALSNSVTLTRTGTDLTVTFGFTYTAFVNSFGFQFLVVPNLALLGGLNAGPQSIAPKH